MVDLVRQDGQLVINPFLQIYRCKESMEEVARIAELICHHHSGFPPSTSSYLNGKRCITYYLDHSPFKRVSANNVVIIFTVLYLVLIMGF